MQNSKQIISARKATQLVFLVCGLGISSWAPMVPLAKERLQLNEADLGLIMLLLGFGAMLMMPISGLLISKFGSRKVIAGGIIVAAIALPTLLIAATFAEMALALFIFGCGIGTVDVSMNAQGIQVQNSYGKSIMSSLHGLFSVGGLLGSLGLGFLIKLGLNPLYSSLTIAFLLIILLITQYKNLFAQAYENEIIEKYKTKSSEVKNNKNYFQWFNSSVLLIGFMCFATFLSEGAMLDWSAVYLTETRNITPEFAGIGYASFSIAMAIMRLSGDKIIERLNNKIIVVGGSLIAVIGLILIITSPWIILILAGFILLGVGASNIVPIFFSEAGRIEGVSSTTGISAITTMGYAGQLAGPALLGFIAHKFSLGLAFGVIAFLMLLVALIYSLRKSN